MGAPKQIVALVDRFRDQYDSYRLPSYGETELRREFIDPFFKALGWDIDNEQGNAEAYKDVIHEDSIKIGVSTKAPDYSFRIGGTRKFFVEAKKPSVNVGQDVSPAFQLRRYGWSAKLSLSILTDFEEFAVYDCRVRPEKNDKASTARTLYLSYQQYDERWDEIASIFSLDAIRKGSFDRYAESTKKKRGTAEVDDAFLKEIEEWRSDLARNLASRNSELSQREINFAVQKTIDRIIFLRICEDRGIEIYGGLQSLTGGPKVYPRLCEMFRKADDRYNSGLFHFNKEKNRSEEPDEWTLSLQVDDRVLKDILRKLYYPESPYEFSVMPAEILGQVYEQFLGKVIRLTKGHQAKVEDKPEVKKAGGVYYTPAYIVDYIVEQTVGKLLEGKSPHEVAARTKATWKPAKGGRPLTVLDPACGSGSFLIGAYQYLLDWYRDWYVEHDPAKHKDRIYQTRKDQWRLTTAERKRILLDHIYGVDIDTQAVEVTKLSLLLKVLEGENQESLQRQLRLFRERALPDLANNIKCGNSLIGPDFYRDKQLDLFDEDERLRINVFDWSGKDGFREIMKSGGFDAVIGNPPYVRSINLKESVPFAWEYYRNAYKTASQREWDIYLVFVERGIGLLSANGSLGFILPNKFINSQVGENLREIISSGSHLRKLINFGAFQVFRGVTTYTCLLFLNRAKQDSILVSRYLGDVRSASAKCPLPESAPEQWTASTVVPDMLASETWNSIVSTSPIRRKLMKWPRLGTLADIYSGTGTRADQVYLIEQGRPSGTLLRGFSPERDVDVELERLFLKPVLRGRNISRYGIKDADLYLIVPYEATNTRTTLVAEATLGKVAPRTYKHLMSCRGRLDARENGRFKKSGWFQYGRPQNHLRFEVSEKIVMPDVADRGTCYMDRSGFWLLDTAYAITKKENTEIDLAFILGLLNSRLLTFFLKETGTPLRGGYFRMKTAYLSPFPVRTINSRDKVEKAQHDRMVELVERMPTLHDKSATAKTTHERTALARQIEATDQEIDRLVYELYGLTDEEIHIVEEATAR
ncbi:MAG TPA: TaqI-like C-terminal specificity domain-containing protein [Pirellulaceae bacterium]|nr:TaqI-like C-terminal specificity domain-containing protein [Pirellulaceae bacterium]